LHGADEAADVERTAHALQAAGVDVELLSPGDLVVRYPEIDVTSVAVAVWEPGAGYADPVLTTTSYFDAARGLGVEVRIKTSVVAVTPGSPVVIETSSGKVTADRVLVAAGPWTRHLAATFGVELPIHAERHIVASLRCGSASPPYILADTVTGWYGKPDLGGHYLVGGLTAEPAVDADDVSERVTDDELLRYTGMFVGRFTELEDVTSLAGGWAGVYDVSPDWQPLIGVVAPNVIVDCGSSGHGFKLAPVLGALIADLVAGDDVTQLAEFHPQRFVAGQALAAGFGDSRILG
jgi:glycine/D-amino acid oxidase-like deaminating enzyme